MKEYKLAKWIAWKLPPTVLLWAFVRAYALSGNAPTSDYKKVFDQIVNKYNLKEKA